MYWFRRLLVLGVACALVVGIARLLDWTQDGSDDPTAQQGDRAAAVAASAQPSASSTGKPRKPRKADREQEPQPKEKELAEPHGTCEDSDVLVTPVITGAHAGSEVKIVLEVTTVKAAACFWEVSPDSVFVNIDGEEGTLWSSQQCPDVVPTESVVPRRERPAKVRLWWNGKQSDEGCPVWTEYVLSGGYTVVAAARGSVTPVAIGFVLGGAVAPTVTKTPTPTPTPTGTRGPKHRRER